MWEFAYVILPSLPTPCFPKAWCSYGKGHVPRREIEQDLLEIALL